jgi:hypothetical protein
MEKRVHVDAPKELHVRPANMEDMVALAPYLRKEDRQEIQAAVGLEPLEALTIALEVSEKTMVALWDGVPFCAFGVRQVPTTPGAGAVWLLGTGKIKALSRTFLRNSRGYFDDLCEGYTIVGNYVDKRNKVHHRWIEWLGLSFVGEVPKYGHEKRRFLAFAKTI